MAHLLLYEQFVHEHGPLTRTRPVFELRCGTQSLGDRLAQAYAGAQLYHQVRGQMAAVHARELAARGRGDRVNEPASALDGDVLLLDGAVLARDAAALPALEGPDEVGVVRDVVNYRPAGDGASEPVHRDAGRVVYLRLCRRTAAALVEQVGPDPDRLLAAALRVPGINRRDLGAEELPVMTYPWQLIENNGHAIEADFGRMSGGGIAADAWVDPGVVWLRDGRRLPGPGAGTDGAPVRIGAGTVVGPFVSFDVSAGPVIVGRDVIIESHCHIKGPAYIGDGCTLWAFTDLKENCSLGPRCRVCGQVEEVIFQGYMHKFHVGFVGHSYLGEGVNVGDQTVTSNLKNDRTPVDVHWGPAADQQVNTGRLYAGALIGDGVATGTNTNLTTGAVVEPLSTIVSAAATPKYINGLLSNGRHLPWPFAGAYNAFRILVSERLGRRLPDGHEALFRHVYAEMQATRRHIRRRDTRRVATG